MYIEFKKRRRIDFELLLIYFFAFIIFSSFVIITFEKVFPNHEIDYIEHEVRKGETVYYLIQEYNQDADINTLIQYAENKNKDIGNIKPGEVVLIPVIKE